ncbi:MAG: AAA family ATPase [Alphaproteobacteria bacterium]|nr:AAA family ATPase [Alphaproteobacteria bacterium]
MPVDAAKEILVFVSSPGDVVAERERFTAVVERFNALYRPGVVIRTLRWEDSFYTADRNFQDQIPDVAGTDLVVCILWRRIGSPLPATWRRRADGSAYESGTVFEFETAMAANAARKTPDILLYRKTAGQVRDTGDPLEEREDERRQEEEQLAGLRAFWRRWFRDAEGHFTAGFHPFRTTDEFERQVEDHLGKWLRDRGHLGRSHVPWPIAERGSPFRGLSPFEESHAEVFFGRSRAVEAAREALSAAAAARLPFLLVLGPSGAGKSSFVRAGLMPRLMQPGAVPDVDLWRRAVVRPATAEGQPMAAVAAALLGDGALPELADGDQGTVALLARQMERDPEGAAIAVGRALERAAAARRSAAGYERPLTARLLLVVDQLEEIFAAPPMARDTLLAFLDALAGAGRTWIVATMRSDFYGRLQAEPRLLALKSAGAAFDLPPLGPAEIAEIVRRPAEAAGLAFGRLADGTPLDVALERAVGAGDALPLLQFALQRLFDARDRDSGTLGGDAYVAMGGLEGAVGSRAEEIYAALPATAQAALPALLRALVRPADEGRLLPRPQPLAALGRDPGVAELVHAFVAARLLTVDGAEPEVRLAHEALLRNWPRAAEALAVDRALLEIRARVQADAAVWRADGEVDDRLLPAGLPLAEAESLLARHGAELDGFDPGIRPYIEASAASARRAATRRLRRLGMAAAALAVLAVAAAGFGWWGWDRSVEADRQRAEAERQRIAAVEGKEAADRHLELATQAANGLVFDLARGMRGAEGVPIETVRRILTHAESVITRLVERPGAGPVQRRLQAVMHIEFASTLATLGDTAAQRQNAERGLAILTEIASAHPDSTMAQRDVMIALNKLGDALFAQGDRLGAAERYRAGLAISRRLVELDRSRIDWQGDVAFSHNRIGDALVQEGKFDEALENYRASLDIVARVAAERTDDMDWQRDLMIGHNRIGDVLSNLGNRAKALESYTVALAIAERLVALRPGNVDWQRDLMISNNKIADMIVAEGRHGQALERYRAALAIAERFAFRDPDDVVWQRDLSVSHNKVGEVLLALGERGRALASFRSALAIRERLVARDANNAGWQRDLLVSHNKVGDGLLAMGDRTAALDSYRAGVAVIERLVRRDEGNVEWRRDLAVSHERVGHLLLLLGDRVGALGSQRRSLAIREKLAADQPGNMDWQRDLSIGHAKLGDVHLVRNEPAAALASYRASFAISERLAAYDERNVEWQRDVAIGHTAIGDAQFALRDDAAGLGSYRAALAIVERLAAAAPENVERQRDLSIARSRLGDALVRAGDHAAALETFQGVLAVREAIAGRDPDNGDRQRDVLLARNRIGDVLAALGRRAEALESYRAGLAIAERAAARYAADAGWQRDMATSHHRIADTHLADGSGAEALAAYRAALAVREALVTRDPENTAWQLDVAWTHHRIGNALRAQGDRAAAIASRRTGIAVAERLLDAARDDAAFQLELAGNYESLGDLYLETEDTAAAREHHRAALAIRERFAPLRPDDAGAQRDLSISLYRLAVVARAAGDMAEARRMGRRALANVEQGLARALDVARGRQDRDFLLRWIDGLADPAR